MAGVDATRQQRSGGTSAVGRIEQTGATIACTAPIVDEPTREDARVQLARNNATQNGDQRSTERAMTIRCTSLVPSPISHSFASR